MKTAAIHWGKKNIETIIIYWSYIGMMGNGNHHIIGLYRGYIGPI